MASLIRIPAALRQFTEKRDEVLVDGVTVGEMLRAVTGRYSQLRKQLYAENGELRAFVNVYVNNDDIRFLQNDATPVSENDVISIIPSIAGG